MLVYEIKSTIKTPHYNKWFKTSYIDNGELLFKNFINKEYDNPKDWKQLHKEFDYNFSELLQLKNKLNNCKSKLDFTLSNKNINKNYALITNITRDCEKLRSYNGHIKSMYNGEIVTNAWLKMYELSYILLTPLLKNKTSINTFHLAEAPGNFLLAINHFIKVNYPDITWNWIANSYNINFYKNNKYFGDSYNLKKLYPDNWDFGCDKDGDITSVENIQYYNRKYGKKNIQFITSDAKCVKDYINFDNEELINIPVHTSQIINSLLLINKGGNIVLKHFTFFESQSLCLITLVKIFFERVFIIKPISSKPANSETYLACTNCIKKPTKVQQNKLLNYLNYIRFLNTEYGCPSLFKNCHSNEFINEIINISKKICDRQMTYIDNNLAMYYMYKDVELSKIWNDMRNKHTSTITTWINTFDIKPLDDKYKMLKN